MAGQRRSIRLQGYDYSQTGAYFITLCTQNRESLFGDILNGVMHLNDAGRMVQQCWDDVPLHFPQAALDTFVVMPNHIHGIVVIVGDAGVVTVGRKIFRPNDPMAHQKPSVRLFVVSKSG